MFRLAPWPECSPLSRWQLEIRDRNPVHSHKELKHAIDIDRSLCFTTIYWQSPYVKTGYLWLQMLYCFNLWLRGSVDVCNHSVSPLGVTDVVETKIAVPNLEQSRPAGLLNRRGQYPAEKNCTLECVESSPVQTMLMASYSNVSGSGKQVNLRTDQNQMTSAVNLLHSILTVWTGERWLNASAKKYPSGRLWMRHF